jgi:metal-responsive CopG/Arc/MetJ family transcriptional regulator
MQTQTLNISLPKNLVQKIDEVAQKEYRNRSELIREALRAYLKDLREWEELFNFGQKQARRLGIKSEKDIERLVSEYRKSK